MANTREIVMYCLFFCRFEDTAITTSRSFFTEIIASVSDIKFSKGGRYILSRDYMTLKVRVLHGALCLIKSRELHLTTCILGIGYVQ